MNKSVKMVISSSLFFLVACAVCMPSFADQTSQSPEEKSSWFDSFGNYLVFWKNDPKKSDDELRMEKNGWKKIPVDFSDFLPDNLPGIAEYRKAVELQSWPNRPRHTEQEVYDLFKRSAQKGNILAVLKQYEMYRQNPVATEEGRKFFADGLESACQQAYQVAVTGNPDAQYLYARHCVNFKSARAQSWFTRAMKQYRTFADRNVPYAQYMMGEIYRFYGQEITAQDWYIRAAGNGSRDAVCRISLKTFHEKEVWKNLGDDVKQNNSCAVYQGLREISRLNENRAVAHAAAELLRKMPVGYAQKGFTDEGLQFMPAQAGHEQDEKPEEPLTAAQKEKAARLLEKYGRNRRAFIDDYLDRFDWNRLSPFGD